MNKAKISYLIGAGASRAFKYPVMGEFYPSSDSLSKEQALIIELLKDYFAPHPLDLENILALLRPIEELAKTGSGSFLKEAFGYENVFSVQEFVWFTYRLCIETYGRAVSLKEVSSLYLPLLEVSGWSDSQINVYTTNYDPVSDLLVQLARDKGFYSSDGFDLRGNWDPTEYTEKTCGLNSIRMHGAISWYLHGKSVKNSRRYNPRFDGSEHVLFYPGLKSSPENSELDPIRQAFEWFKADLEDSKFLIVIGFSFRDRHIVNAIEHSIGKNNLLRVVVIDPRAAQVSRVSMKIYQNMIPVNRCFGDEDVPHLVAKILGAT